MREFLIYVDAKNIGSAKIIDAMKSMLDDCQYGVIALSENSLKSAWVWYEAGILEGIGKREIHFSLVTGKQAENLRPLLPDLIRLYNILEKFSDLVDVVREETFFAGRLRKNPLFHKDTYSKLKSNEIQVVFPDTPCALQSRIRFGLLFINFETNSALEQVTSEMADRDGSLLNEPLAPKAVRVDQSGRKCSVSFSRPIHKILGTQFKFFIDIVNNSLLPDVEKYLKEEGAPDVGRSASGETQRIYFTVRNEALRFNVTSDGIGNNYLYPI